MKILHLPYTVGGNPQGLSRHLNLLGVQSETWTLYQNYLAFNANKVIFNEKDRVFVRELKRLWALRYIFLFDVIFFNFGTSLYEPFTIPEEPQRSHIFKIGMKIYQSYVFFMQKVELALLRIFNKIVFIQYQGDDARQGDYCQKHFSISIAHETGSDYYTPESDETTRQRIKRFDELADLIYAVNPDLLWVLPKRARFVPYAHLDITDWLPVSKETPSAPVVLHAPSHRGAKGTRYIVEAINRLKSEGIPLEFILVEDISNAEARKLYERADLVVDQLLVGWYGGFAVEAMALGKPTICYLRQSDFVFLPEQMRSDLPLIVATPADIYAVLHEWLVHRREELQMRGAISRRYVERWHDPLRIASELKADYERIASGKRERGGVPADPAASN